jgi:RNA polymerase sigma-70 factor, ECF subfamily
MFWDAIRRTAVTSRDRTIEDTPVATCTISPAATNAISFEKSARVAHELTLVRRAQRGDEEVFATLFQLNRRWVYSVCISMTRDASEAEDLTQEAFIQVFHKVGTFRGDSAFSSWLHRVAVNTVLMKRRRRKTPPMLSLDAPVSSDSPSLRHELGKRDPNLSGAIDRISLHRAIQALPAGCRKIFGLHEVDGYQRSRDRRTVALLHWQL